MPTSLSLPLPSATSLFPITVITSQANAFRTGAAVSVTGGTGQGAAALHPAGLRLTSFFFFFYITKLEA